jgi:hypothetical protein
MKELPSLGIEGAIESISLSFSIASLVKTLFEHLKAQVPLVLCFLIG